MVERIHKSLWNKQKRHSMYIEKLLTYLRIYKLYLKKRDASYIKNKNLIEKISEDYVKLEYNKDLLLIILYISVLCNIYAMLMHLFFMYENDTNIKNNVNDSLIFYYDFYKSYNTCNSNINYIT